MMEVYKGWWGRWHVYEVDTGGRAWVATFCNKEVAENWVRWCYTNDDQ